MKAKIKESKNEELIELLDLVIGKIGENDELLNKKIDSTLKTISDDNKSGLDNFIKNTLELKNYLEGLEKEIETNNEKIDKIEFPTKLEVINIPKEIRVSNLDEIKIPEPKEFPKTIEVSNQIEIPKQIDIKKPKWWKALDFSAVLEKLDSIVKIIKGSVYKVDLDKYKEGKNAIAIKFTDKQGNEYDLMEALKKLPAYYTPGGGGGGSSGGVDPVGIKRVDGTTINPATEETLDIIAGEDYDRITNTYDGSGNLLTATFKMGATTIRVYTMTYDASDNLLTFIKT